jgi:hypothetical protein
MAMLRLYGASPFLEGGLRKGCYCFRLCIKHILYVNSCTVLSTLSIQDYALVGLANLFRRGGGGQKCPTNWLWHNAQWRSFLGAFALSWKAPFSFAMFVRPSARLSVRMYKLGSHRTNFREIWYWRLLLQSVEIVRIWLKCDKNIGHFTWTRTFILLAAT